MSDKTRNQLSLKDKYEIIIKLKDGAKRKDLMEKYQIKNRSYFTNLLKSEQKIIDKYKSVDKKLSKSVSRVRTSNYPKVEEVINIALKFYIYSKVSYK